MLWPPAQAKFHNVTLITMKCSISVVLAPKRLRTPGMVKLMCLQLPQPLQVIYIVSITSLNVVAVD